MLEESSINQNKNTYSKTPNTLKENMICKDGFCSLPNQKKISEKDKNNMNFFDPIE